MSFCNVPARKAVATSAVIGFPIALVGTIGFIVSGWNSLNLPEWSLALYQFESGLEYCSACVDCDFGCKAHSYYASSCIEEGFRFIATDSGN